MVTFLMVIQLVLAIALIGVVLLQKSKGEGLGAIGGAAQMFFDQAKGFDQTLVRATGIIAAVFMVMSAVLAYLA